MRGQEGQGALNRNAGSSICKPGKRTWEEMREGRKGSTINRGKQHTVWKRSGGTKPSSLEIVLLNECAEVSKGSLKWIASKTRTLQNSVRIKRSHMKSCTALDNEQEPHHPSFLRPARDYGWQSLNTVVQWSENQGQRGSLLLCHFLAVPVTLGLFPNLSNGIKKNKNRVMGRDSYMPFI